MSGGSRYRRGAPDRVAGRCLPSSRRDVRCTRANREPRRDACAGSPRVRREHLCGSRCGSRGLADVQGRGLLHRPTEFLEGRPAVRCLAASTDRTPRIPQEVRPRAAIPRDLERPAPAGAGRRFLVPGVPVARGRLSTHHRPCREAHASTSDTRDRREDPPPVRRRPRGWAPAAGTQGRGYGQCRSSGSPPSGPGIHVQRIHTARLNLRRCQERFRHLRRRFGEDRLHDPLPSRLPCVLGARENVLAHRIDHQLPLGGSANSQHARATARWIDPCTPTRRVTRRRELAEARLLGSRDPSARLRHRPGQNDERPAFAGLSSSGGGI